MSGREQIAWCLVAYLGWTVLIALVGKRPGPRDPDQTRWAMPVKWLLWPLLFMYALFDLPRFVWSDLQRQRKER